MISVRDADSLLESFHQLFPSESVSLERASGRVLREPILADQAYPAQDRSRMDGVAIAFRDWDRGVREFALIGMAKAGEARRSRTRSETCFEVMTGAPCPEGCDAVIPYEEISMEKGAAKILAQTVRPAQYVHAKGSDCPAKHVLVAEGLRLTAPRIAAAASVGKSRIAVARFPRITVLATGDELVDVTVSPAPHQIRMSNPHGLRAMLQGLGEVRIEKVGDHPALLSACLAKALAGSDVVLVTGGVSAGKLDFVPGVLEQLGVEKVFHHVAQRPGKPLWFGAGPGGRLVFGLPGNPVSALCCARRFVAPLLQAKSGLTPAAVPRVRLAAAVKALKSLTWYLPVLVRADGAGDRLAEPMPTNGSGDFAGLGASDGFVELAQDSEFHAGDAVPFYAWEP